jgi:hypothetical protein
MSTRLQVVVDEAELEGYQRAARRHGLTLSEWVRQVLRREEIATVADDIPAKLAAIRSAAQHDVPTADVDTMLAEIERGRADPSL